MILDELLSSQQLDAPVRAVLVGVHWTVVCSRYCGMASTLMDERPHGHQNVRGVGELHTKSARELAEYARSENLLEASIGLAALNSLLDIDESQMVEMNAADVLIERSAGKQVALVGHFPFIPRLREVASQLWVIEQRPLEDEYPEDAADELIPQADVVAVTGSAVINHTIDHLLALCQPCRMVIVLGPSTPLSQVLFSHGATILSGIRVVDEEAVLRTVGQGASFPQVAGVRLLTITRAEMK